MLMQCGYESANKHRAWAGTMRVSLGNRGPLAHSGVWEQYLCRTLNKSPPHAIFRADFEDHSTRANPPPLSAFPPALSRESIEFPVVHVSIKRPDELTIGKEASPLKFCIPIVSPCPAPTMADPLSIAASIAGVISLADIVFIRTRKYLSSAKNADKEVKDLSQEVLLFSGALHSLSRLAQALDADGLKDQHIDNLRMHHIAACHATLDEVAKKLKKFEDNGTKRTLVWPIVSDRTKELFVEISRHKQNIDLALTADSLGTLLQVLSKTEEVQVNTEKLLDEAKKTREIITRIHQDSGRKAILDYFLLYNPQQNYEMSLSLRHPRTGLWLTRRPEFQTWLHHPDSALWLSGIPGAGKTVLAGTIIEEALKKSSEDIAVAFFFCDYKNTETKTSVNVLSALASQLAIQKEEAYGYIDRYYQELHPGRGLERRPTVFDLQRILKDMIKLFDHVYLIVDGLDECGDNTDSVIDGILDVVECSDNTSTALLSRDEYNIRDRLEGDFTGIEIAAHTEDVTEYVTSEIEKRISNKSLRIDDLNLKGEILERLIDGAKGM